VEIVAFIDEHRERFGVEPICRVLTEHGCKIAPNTFWVAKKRAPSQRAVRDAVLAAEVVRVFEDNLFVYGADKVWAQLNREHIRVARCTVERLMRAQGLSGARRGKAFTITTTSDDRQQRPADLVERRFPGACPESVVGRRSDLREDPLGLGLRGVHHRRLLAHDRRLSSVAVAAFGSPARCTFPRGQALLLRRAPHRTDCYRRLTRRRRRSSEGQLLVNPRRVIDSRALITAGVALVGTSA